MKGSRTWTLGFGGAVLLVFGLILIIAVAGSNLDDGSTRAVWLLSIINLVGGGLMIRSSVHGRS